MLLAAYSLLSDRDSISSDEVIAAIEPEPAHALTAVRALNYLSEQGYIDGTMYLGSVMPENIRATEKGLQVASGWPVAGNSHVFASEFVKALTDRINNSETAEDERGKLKRLRDASEDVGVRLIAEIVARTAEHKGL